MLQQQHYECIAAEYDSHYNDLYSHRYMRKFAFEPMFDEIDLKDKNVLEAMCGGGQTTNYLLERGAKVTGLDISPQQASNFKLRHPDTEVRCGSILNSDIASDSFDIISVVGGIHHMPPHIEEAVLEIHRILKPGGYFCFMEPHSETAVDRVRRAWYKRDPLFAKNEEAINMTELRETFVEHFEFKHEFYGGNFGYLFVLNSMVFRIPLFLKPLYSPAMMAAETVFNKVGGKLLSCFVVAQWQKK
jgi:SAM-dependent methyltransferase